MEGLVKASSFNLGRMLYGDGTGALATVSSHNVINKEMTCDKVNNLIEGMLIDVFNENVQINANPLKIVYVDRVNKKIKYTGKDIITINNGYKIYVQGSKIVKLQALEKSLIQQQLQFME